MWMPAFAGCQVEAPASANMVLADELRLRQVLINMLSNALRYTSSGSVKLALQTEGESVRLSVTDTGGGIAGDDQEAIFQPFVQLNANSKGGAGLGLSISRQLIEDMGGKLQLISEVGKGSEFHFSLPLAGEGGDEASLDGLRVLLVEDDTDISAIYQIWLADWGCQVVPTISCEQALNAFDASATDLVLSDLLLEDGNGADLLRQLREEVINLPAVVCSGSEAGLLGHEGSKDASTVLLSKPVSATRLRSALQTAMRLSAT